MASGSMSPSPAGRSSSEIRFDELARMLEVLANPNRLRLLHQLREPKATSEITLQPEAPRKGENPERPISRQGVQLHLERLASIELVATSKEHRGKALVEVHTINYPRLFALFEEFRALGLIKPLRESAAQATIPGSGLSGPPKASAPHLMIVRGLQEGTVFSLADENRTAPGSWLLGRKRNLPVCLDYDPYVSAENSELRRRSDGAFTVRSLSSSRNGTTVNLRLLGVDEECPLRHGDLVGAGRTLLIFRAP